MTGASIAIVGAGLAGARGAQALRRKGFDGTISLIGAESHLPYDRPPLSKAVLAGAKAPQDTQLHDEQYWTEQRVDLHLGQPVVAVHRSAREVELANGRALPADQVLLCTGGRARTLDVAGSELGGVWCLRTLDDAVGLHEQLVPGARVVVVGAGFIGAEVAATAQQHGCDVTLVEIAQVPLWRVLGEDMGRYYGQVHRDHGVRLLTGVGVDDLVGDTAVRGVRLSDGSSLEADVVVVGVGIVPSTELASELGAEVGNGIIVDEYCRTSVDGVFAAGDVANFPDAILGERVRLEHWQNAQNQAGAAAGSMLGEREPFCEVPWFWSDQYDLRLQVAGHPHSRHQVVYRGQLGDEKFSAFYLEDDLLRAVLAVNRPGDVRAGMDLIAAGTRLAADVLRDASVDLRALGRAARQSRVAAGTLATA